MDNIKECILFLLGIPIGMLFFLGLFIAFAYGFNYWQTNDLIKRHEDDSQWK